MVQSFPFHTHPSNSRPIVISLMIVITLKKDAKTGFIRYFNVLWGLPHPIHCCQFPAHLSLILYLLTCVWCSYVGVGVFLCLYCCRKRSSLYIKSPVPLLAHTPQTLKSTQEEMRGRGGEGGGRGAEEKQSRQNGCEEREPRRTWGRARGEHIITTIYTQRLISKDCVLKPDLFYNAVWTELEFGLEIWNNKFFKFDVHNKLVWSEFEISHCRTN